MDEKLEDITCPVCGKENAPGSLTCSECSGDLSLVKGLLNLARKHYNSALNLAEKGQLAAATVEIRAAIEIWEKNPDFHNLLGTLYARQGLFDKAVEAWKQTLSLNPSMERAAAGIEKVRAYELNSQTPQKREEKMKDSEMTPRKGQNTLLTVLLALLVLLSGGAAFYLRLQLNEEIRKHSDMVADYSRLEKEVTELRDNEEQLEFVEGLLRSQEEIINASRALVVELRETSFATQQKLDAVSQELSEARSQASSAQTLAERRLRELERLREQQTGRPTVSQEEFDRLKSERDTLQSEVQSFRQQVTALRESVEEANREVNRQTQLRDQRETEVTAIQTQMEDSRVRLTVLEEEKTNLIQDLNRHRIMLENMRDRQRYLSEAMENVENGNLREALETLASLGQRFEQDRGIALIRASVEKEMALRQDPLEQALRDHAEQVRSNPQSAFRDNLARESLREAEAAFRAGELNRANAYLERAEFFNPGSRGNDRLRSRILQGMEERRSAVDRALEKAKTEAADGRIEAAISTLAEVTRRYPEADEAVRLGMEYEAQRNLLERQRTAAEEMRRADRRAVATLLEEARGQDPYRAAESLRQAMDLSTALLEAHPGDTELRRLQVEAAKLAQERDRRVADIMRRVDAIWRGNNYMGVIQMMDEVLAWETGNARARTIRTEAQERIARIDTGMEEARALLSEGGDTEKAAAVLRGVLEIDPNNTEARALLNEIQSVRRANP